MAAVIRMPGVSADAGAATLVEWAVAVGDTVAHGQVVATVETDKAVVDLESDAAGVLMCTFAEAGDTVDVGGPIAVLLQDGESAEDEAAILAELGLGVEGGALEDGAPEPEPLPSQTGSSDSDPNTLSSSQRPEAPTAPDAASGDAQAGTAPATPVEAADGRAGRIFATPLVRRLADEAGIPLSALTGTGPGGRIRRRDLDAHLATAAAAAAQAAPEAQAPRGSESHPLGTDPANAEWTDEPVTRFRRAVASALTRSKQEVPHFYLKATCRAESLIELRRSLNSEGATGKVTVNDFVVKAAAIALSRVPQMNVNWAGDSIRQFGRVDVAVAMDTARGLVVPVLRSADTRSLSDLSATIKDLAARAAGNTLQQRELEGGALAISNLGMFGVQEFSAIINPPQVGILAVGAIGPQAVESADGELELARCLTVVLSADHRPVDGAVAARWLAQFKTLIENPLQILI